MRRAMALATATAASVVLIYFVSVATAPPVMVEISSVEGSPTGGSSPVDEIYEPALPLTDPAVIVLPGSAMTLGTTTTTRDFTLVTVAPTTTRTPAATTTTRVASSTTATTPAATTAPAVTTTTAAPISTTTITVPAVTTTAVTTTTAVIATGSFSPGGESEFLSKMNGLRASVGVAGLASNSELNNYARWWAKQMADSGSISHSTDSLSSLIDPWSYLAENVGSGPSVSSLFNALVNSPAHYPNMVNPIYTSVGVGVYIDASGFLWTAHVFGG